MRTNQRVRSHAMPGIFSATSHVAEREAIPTCFLAPISVRAGCRSGLQTSRAANPPRLSRQLLNAPIRRARVVASVSNGTGNRPYGKGASGRPLTTSSGSFRLHVVFVHPQIHWNTGNIGRTCLGLGATLHLIHPLGFSLDERQVRRAGLDYWTHVDVRVHGSWEEFANGDMREIGGTRLFFTKFGDECATRVKWPREGNVVLIFGSEVDGFDGIRAWMEEEGKTERRVAFPMVDERFRSFNLSTSASMVSLKEMEMEGHRFCLAMGKCECEREKRIGLCVRLDCGCRGSGDI